MKRLLLPFGLPKEIGTSIMMLKEIKKERIRLLDRVKDYLDIISVVLQSRYFSFIFVYHHHHIVLAARISLTLSHHSSLSFIALGRSSGQQPVSSHSCWMYVRAGRSAFARPCVGIHKSTSLMSSSLLLQQCPACLVRLTWIVFVIVPYFEHP